NLGGSFRLPTEAEWEYSCRASTTTPYYWGEALDKKYCWHNETDWTSHAVGQKLPNNWGLYDMSGNVWEWCSDWYGGYNSAAQTDPIGPPSGSLRTLRGSSFAYDNNYCRSANRHGERPYLASYQTGFRLAMTSPPDPNAQIKTKVIDLGGGVKLEMAWIPPNISGKGFVNITEGFWMSKYEATNAQYSKLTGSSIVGDNYPLIASSTIYSAYINRLNQMKIGTFKLPTEQEWEYACRAGTITNNYWGDGMNGDYCWYSANSGGVLHPVGQKLPNKWGLYDMIGNAFEWTSSIWIGNVVRGGFYTRTEYYSSSRDWTYPDSHWSNVFKVGFRVIMR
ncbi:MAG TPA: formylglycine-generating enzyme family protein, partial [Candidatus Wallbacteria bacterium]|nr:formylglycine-generating enzyme family protein [Candidatus Wallbacteria bacterium]